MCGLCLVEFTITTALCGDNFSSLYRPGFMDKLAHKCGIIRPVCPVYCSINQL